MMSSAVWKLLLPGAFLQKNVLKNVYGFSPNQLVFGRNPNFPVAVDSDVPALESKTLSQVIADHLNAMNKAREAFVQC